MTRARHSLAFLGSEARGAVLVEFMIAFVPVFTFFLCLVQLGLLYAVRLATEHAAITTARAAAVVVGDDPKRYGNENPPNQFQLGSGSRRYQALRQAALFTLSPFILDGTIESVNLVFPRPETPGGEGQSGTIAYAAMNESQVTKMRVRVEVVANCKIALGGRIACAYLSELLHLPSPTLPGVRPYPTKTIRAEAIFPYQGASYDYP